MQTALQRSVADSVLDRPLVVDLDGTLIKSDLLIESFFTLLSARPLQALIALAALRHGKAALKARIAADCEIDAETLPFNPELLDYLQAEKSRGRQIYLASASDRILVERVAAAIGLFDGVFASDGATNLAGTAKALALIEAFGPGGFDYAGNARADFPVWHVAHEAIVVGAGGKFTAAVQRRYPGTRAFDARCLRLKDYLRALRVHQWLKNLLIVVPSVAAHRFGFENLTLLGLAFLSFSFCASSVYLLNDLLDLRNDRTHSTKRNRPLAAGRVPLIHGIVLAPALMALAVVLGLALPREFLAILVGYYLITMVYSLWLKRKVTIDVLTLACLYGVRLLAGSVALAVPLSPWLVAFSIFLFLSLAIIKRCTEVIDRIEKGKGDPAGRGYILRDLPMLEAMAAASAYVAVMVFSLYINSPAVLELYRAPVYLWLICLVLFYWLSRILLLTHRGEMHDDPVVFAATDGESLICGALIMAIAVFSI
jgi:4-hydroxybenzoate polyprenyltransferase/phosphoserine phosphatase